ncbi:MAG: AIR synthase family protein [Actinobacteria bacterium]|nr:AIR synthase family protein [Actinomycetota bacterium]
MEQLQRPGKLSPRLFEGTIFDNLGAPWDQVLVGPQHGVDVGVVRTGPGTVMALTSDPVFVVPAYGWERAAWFAVHILASDAAVSALPLTWMAVDLNLPLTLSDDDLSVLWRAFSATCNDLGIAVVSGHTGRYAGCDWPMVGGAVCAAMGSDDAYITPAMARPGDRIVVTKGAAIEATALFGATFPDRLAAGVGPDVARAADALFESQSVVPEARVAAAYGVREEGVSAMHDATEGGVLGGLAEIALASGVGMRVRLQDIPVRPEVRAVCDHVGIDPYTSISEGTLLATVRPEHETGLMAALTGAGIDAAVIGDVTEPGDGVLLETPEGTGPLVHPEIDPFWAAFGAWAEDAAAAN